MNTPSASLTEESVAGVHAPAPAKIVLYANTEWYLYNFRRSLALALQRAGHEVLLLSPDGPYGERLRALGLRWQPVPMARRSLNPLRELRLVWYLWRLLRRERVGLVHSFTIKCAVYGAIAARLAGAPRVSAVAGMGYVFTAETMRARALRRPVRWLLHRSVAGEGARVILQNADDAAGFEAAGIVERGAIRLIPGSGVDCARFVRCPRRRAPGGPMTVLLAARLLWDKGIAEYVAAARRLRAAGRPIRWLLAGMPDAGNPDMVARSEVEAWVEQGLLEWLGHVDDMPGLLRQADVVVLPTSYGEGLPKSLIEAAACALPLVTTDVPGCRAVVDHERTGLLVPPRDGDALAEAIARLHDDPALAARLGAAADEKARAEFDERIVVRRTLAVYDELLLQRAR